ncbi:NAD(P)-binding protein [Melanomma pulvis-pyrius CBS 109.77]|uniref:NAD(P)-binding protein n=1 Tax=Melanomma pulvis-pyrius CBS 109.77 TaxID=1314802 RepID=A0A6A6XDT1_9PLEO|nr:NAD(P)-binding protein [Melanomma pulvis-pyrius CBS 109.77]
MSKTTVLLVGATGETGSDILNGLIEDGNFEISILVQPSSASKPAVKAISTRGIKVIVADLSGSIEDLTAAITGYSTIISAVGMGQQALQLSLVDAAVKAGTTRFVPCAFTTVCPPSGIMTIREDKEQVYRHIWGHHLPYTIIDVGYWHQISWPRLSSGKLDYACVLPKNEVYGDGEAKTLLTDKRDIGRFVARIVRDGRTLNKKVFTHSDFLSQNEIIALLEAKSGEKIEYSVVSEADVLARRAAAREAVEKDPTDYMKAAGKSQAEYIVSKYLRRDNTPEVARYLGYLDARELYPDFEPVRFEAFVGELLEGKGTRPYASRF